MENKNIETLKNQLKEVACDVDIARNQYSEENIRVKSVFESILLKFLPADMIVRSSHLEVDWIGSKWTWQWRCEVVRSGFEYHSSFDVYFREGGNFSINNGCIGTYDKTEVGYISAIKTMAGIWDHINEIEEALNQVSFEKLRELMDAKYQVEVKQSKIESEIKKIEEAEFEAKLFAVGTVIALQEKHNDWLFNTPVYVNPNCGDLQGYCNAKVVKVTPKKVLFDIHYGPFANYNYTDIACVKKDKVIQAVKNSSWKIIENN